MFPLVLIETRPVDIATSVVLPAQTVGPTVDQPSTQVESSVPPNVTPHGGLSPLDQPTFSSGVRPDLLLAQAITPADAGTVVTPIGDQVDITGGHLSGDGANLFHSFEQFGLSTDQTANFIATPQIQNVLGRVVGGDASVIDGLLRLSNSDANLFLINPAGILFGANARLNLPGSFTATTADRVGFEDAWLDAFEQTDYSQLVGEPTQFSFGSLEPGSLVNTGNLAVGDNQSLTLLGGNVVNTGTLAAPGGRITVEAVPGQQTVRFGLADGLLSVELDPLETARSTSALSLPALLTGGAVVEVTGITVNPDGTVSLNGVTIPEGSGTVAMAGAADVSGAVPGQQGGEINILGERVGLIATRLEASGAAGGGTVRVGGGYQGQEMVPNADITYVSPDSAIFVNGEQTGNGGRAILWADGHTQFYGLIDAQGGSQSGNGGFVEASGLDGLVYEGSVNLNAPAGNMGALLLDPQNITIIDAAANAGDEDALLGGGPDVLLQATDLPNTFEISRGTLESFTGDVTLRATNSIVINNLSFSLANDTLDLQAGSILFDAGNGTFVMNADDTIRTAGGSVTIAANTINIGNIETAGGDIVLDGAVVIEDQLFASAHEITTGSGSGDITFRGTLNSQDSITPVSLIVTAGEGNVVFEEAIGSIHPLANLDISGFNNFNVPIPSGNDVSLRDFAGNTLRISSRGDVTIDAIADLSSRMRIRTDGNIGVETEGNLALTNSFFFTSSGTGDIQLIAGMGSIELDSSTLDNGFGELGLQAQSIEVLNGSRLEARDTLNLEAQGTGNALTIRDSSLTADRLIMSATNGALIVENGQILSRLGFTENIGEILGDAQAIDIQGNSTLEADGSITLEATGETPGGLIRLDSSRLRAAQDINLLAQNGVQIEDGVTPSIIRTNQDLLIQGGQFIDIQSLNQPQSVFRTDGNITLSSDGLVSGQGRFLNGGDFSVLNLSNAPGEFSYTPITSNGIISAGGDVSFGDYTGNSLKVEAGGSITVDGDISITAPDTTLQGTDPDIVILANDAALILRAGLAEQGPSNVLPSLGELRNEPNPGPVNGLFFDASAISSSGNITVGNIETNSGPVILSAQGNIETGDITTGGDDGSPIDGFGGYVDLSAGGNIDVSTINTSGNDGGDVTIDAGGIFRATGAFLSEDFTIDGTSSLETVEGAQFLGATLLTSINATGGGEGGATIDIQHGGRTFTVGPSFQTDKNGIVFRRFSLDGDGNVVLGERVFPSEDEVGKFVNEANEAFFDVIAVSEPFNSTDPEASFTAGAITSNQDNEGLVVSLRDNPIVGAGTTIIGDGRIEVTSTFTSTGGGGGTGGGGTGGGGTGSGMVLSETTNVDATAAEVQEAPSEDRCGLTGTLVAEAEMENGGDTDAEASLTATRTIDPSCQVDETDGLLQIESNESEETDVN
ncbi:MAG: filamentous hemagglutinin N-terminal domain-containing protein [Cyanobacteria bacterium J06635_1]